MRGTATSQAKARQVFSAMPMDMLKDLIIVLDGYDYYDCSKDEGRRIDRYTKAARRARKERQASP